MEKQKSFKIKDKNTIFTGFCLSIAFVLTIVLSFGVSFFFRPINDTTFWGNLLLALALCIYTLYFGISESVNYYHKKDGGRYQCAVNDFKNVRTLNAERDVEFSQWLEKYYEKNKKDYYKSILSVHGNINPLVLDLDLNELDNLQKPYKKCWKGTEFEDREDTYFRSLTEEQIDAVKDILKGKVKVERLPDDFFKTFNGKILVSEYLEQSKQVRKNNWRYIGLIGFRIIMLIIISVMFAVFGVTISKAGDSQEVLNRVINTISRIWQMVSGFAYGYSLGRIMVMNSCAQIEYKTRVNNEFLKDKTFIGLTEEEVAKQEYERSIANE